MPDSRYALLIANSQYTYMSTLKAPAQDAAALERVLRDPAIGAFTEVTSLVDEASPDNVRDAITHFFADKRPDDVLLVYFSGHGVVEVDDGSLHLAVKETNPKRPYARGLETRFIVDAMKPNRCRAKTIVLIFDCCYSGAFDATQKSAPNLTLEMKQFESGKGRVVITASTAVQPALDAQGERAESLFTHYLVQGLETGQAAPHLEWISVSAAYQYAYTKVKEQQTPEISTYHQQGEILFTRNPRYAPPVSTPPLSLNHHFICYAPRDGAQHAQRLHTALQKAEMRPWLDQRDIPEGHDREAAREDALRECASVLLILTPASASLQSDSAREWRRALRFKKPVILLRFVPGVNVPLMLGHRTVLDFTGSFDKALRDLRRHLADRDSPAWQLRELEYRLADAERELRGASSEQQPRIERDMEQLEAEIKILREVVRDPQAAAHRAEQRIAAALERERQPERPLSGRVQSKFINPPPLTAPLYFQDRHVENRLIADFLRDPARRLLTVVGRGGVGKTALVCRLLKALEAGHLPDDLGELTVSGIVYLSAVGTHRVSFPNLFADLLKLLPAARAQALDALYKEPQKSVADKLKALCKTLADLMPHPVVVLLDNMEDLLDPATHAISDTEVDAALRALLDASPHPVKVLLTSRIAPHALLLLRPERQMLVHLDEGLASPYAEAVLRAGDPSGVLGLQAAPDARLAPACAYTRGYPRALEALTAALNADRATTLAELLAGPPPANVVEAMVGEAYSRLEATAQKVIQGLAVFGRPVPPAAVDYLLQPHLPELDSTPVLNRLVNMRFVTKESGRYYLHPVDRDYALQRLTLEPVADSSQQSTLNQLQSRAADYFRETRAPRAAWKTLADLEPQLAEIDLRYAAGDYEAAADVLTDINYDYLFLWGHYHLLIEQNGRLQGNLSDTFLKMSNLNNLGLAYDSIGQVSKAIQFYEIGVAIARETKNRSWEGAYLGNLGNCYFSLGQTRRAIEFHEQALAIHREIGDQRVEGNQLGNLGNHYTALGQTRHAIAFYEQALTIFREIGYKLGEGIDLENLAHVFIDENRYSDAIQYAQASAKIGEEIGSPQVGSGGYYVLALAHLYAGNLPTARTAAEQARHYDYPADNHKFLALLGIIAWRQNDLPAAQEAFTAALTHAEALLVHTPEYLGALEAKALALAGLVGLQNLTGLGDLSGLLAQARAAYQAARAINSEPGIVQRATRLLNQLENVPRFWEE